MKTPEQLGREAGAKMQRAHFSRERSMITGKRTGSGATDVTLAGVPTNKTWVRGTDDSREETAAWGIVQSPNISVKVDYDSSGELYIKPDYLKGTATVGGALFPIMQPPSPPGVSMGTVDAEDLAPGQVIPPDAPGLAVRIRAFVHKGGLWTTKDVAIAAPATANTLAWVVVGVTESSNVGAYVVGTEYPLGFPLGDDQIAEISLPDGFIPCGAVVVKNGQTAITGSDKFRRWSYFLEAVGVVGTDEKAKVSSNDTTAGYLNGKLVAGSNITLTEGSDGGNETLTIATSGGSGTGISTVPQAYIAGFELSYNGTDLTIQAGAARADGDDYTLVKTTSITINPATTGANGLDTGSLANTTWYYAWVIAKSSDGTTAGLLSTSSTSPTMPTGYDKKRRVGSIKTNGSAALFRMQMLPGQGCARLVQWMEDIGGAGSTNTPFSILVMANIATTPSWTTVDCSAVAPPTSRYIKASYEIVSASTGIGIFYREYNHTAHSIEIISGDTGQTASTDSTLPVDASQRAEVNSSVSATEDFNFRVLGYWDNLLPSISGSSGADTTVIAVDTTNVSNPPTDAELDAIFGTPATLPTGFTAYIDDNNANSALYQVMANGTSWWVFTGTKAV